MLPTISALGAIGDAPVRDDRVSSWYGAAGVNVADNRFLMDFSIRPGPTNPTCRTKAAEQRVLDLRNRISRDVRNSWLNASTGYERVSVSQELLAQANQALDFAQTRYKLGLSSIVELSQAQLQQTQAAIGSAQAEYAYRLSLSVLLYQTSGL